MVGRPHLCHAVGPECFLWFPRSPVDAMESHPTGTSLMSSYPRRLPAGAKGLHQYLEGQEWSRGPQKPASRKLHSEGPAMTDPQELAAIAEDV